MATATEILQEILQRMDRIERKLDLLLEEEYSDQELAEIRREVAELARRVQEGDLQDFVSVDEI